MALINPPAFTGTLTSGFSCELLKQFSPDQHDKYLCCYCERILRKAHQTDCGHRICFACFERAKEEDEEAECKACREEDMESKFSGMKIWADKAITKELGREEFQCINKGCDWTGKFRNYEEHELNCQFAEVACKYCMKMISRSEMKQHQNPKTRECPGLKKGDELTEEEKAGLVQELLELKRQVDKLANMLQGMTRIQEIRDLEEHIKDLEKLVEQKQQGGGGSVTLKDQQGEKEAAQGATGKDTEDSYSTNVNSQEEVILQQHSLEFEAKQQLTQSQLDSELAALQEKLDEFEQIGGTLNRQAEQQATVLQELEQTLKAQRQKTEEQAAKVRELDKKSTSQDAMAKQLKTWQNWQTGASHNGVLVWRIPNLAQRRREAKTTNSKNLYSPPFYTGNPGYKLCARVYLNGDGVGKDTHMSLFFAVMKGDFDPILTWPLQARVTFYVLDQNGQHHTSESFVTDPQSSSCQRPKNDLNTASGCPLFLAQSQLDDSSRGYGLEDTLFLKIVVELQKK